MHDTGDSFGGHDSGGGHDFGGGQPDEIDLSPQAQLIALHDKHGWYASVRRNRKMRILMAIIWAYFVAHGTYLIVSYLFFSHR
jgi:hypothetical protein